MVAAGRRSSACQCPVPTNSWAIVPALQAYRDEQDSILTCGLPGRLLVHVQTVVPTTHFGSFNAPRGRNGSCAPAGKRARGGVVGPGGLCHAVAIGWLAVQHVWLRVVWL